MIVCTYMEITQQQACLKNIYFLYGILKYEKNYEFLLNKKIICTKY